MFESQDIKRPPAEWCAALKKIGAATTTSTLFHMGIRSTFISGPVTQKKGVAIAGPALTLQCMPKREDIQSDGEYQNPEIQRHRHVLYHAQKGDVVVIDARASMESGIFGEMMLTYFAGKGGAGVVVDGCIRDGADAMKLDLGYWLRGFTPNFHVQSNIMPFAVNVPIACGGAFVMPGDIIVADDDGAVVVPVDKAEEVIAKGSEHAEWEVFSKEKLEGGGDLRRYYPLTDIARPEYEEWKKNKSK